MLGYLLKNDFFKGKTIIELYRTLERYPFYERKKKLFDSRERGHLLYPKYNEATLKPCNVPIQIVRAACSTVRTKDDLELLRKLIRASIGNIAIHRKALVTSDDCGSIDKDHQLISDELIDSIIYSVAEVEGWHEPEGFEGSGLGLINHNLIWIFYGATYDGSFLDDPKELYKELPRKTI